MICGEDRFTVVLSAAGFDSASQRYRLLRCICCGLTRTSPLPDEAELAAHYTDDYYGGGDAKFTTMVERPLRWLNGRRAEWLARGTRDARGAAGGLRVLDIGCGRATLLQAFAREHHECHGIERGDFPELAGIPAVRIHRRPLHEAGFPPGYFDLVILWHVLEHLHDPVGTLRECRRVLRPGGQVALAVPNFASWQAQRFGGSWFHLDLPRHLYHFTPESLGAALAAADLVPIAQSTASLEQDLYGFLQSTLNRFWDRERPNRLYAWLKAQRRERLCAALGVQIGLAGLLLPLALMEHWIAALAGRGATLILRAQRSDG